MSPSYVLLLAFLIGLFSGLRSLTPSAVTAWAAHLGWLKLERSLGWIGTTPAAVIFTLLALTGACVAMAGAQGIVLGAVIGIAGALVGTFGGYQVRRRLVKPLGTPDFVVAVLEDLLTIGGSLWVVSRF